MSKNVSTYQEVLRGDDASLVVFLRNMQKFETAFCEKMIEGSDFTLRLELRGALGKMVHCRVSVDHFDRPETVKTKKKNL